jgi:hypothetical protein
MTTLFDSRLSDRDYASYLLHVGDLVKWVESKRLHLQAAPDDMHEFVQVEALLSAIERHANNVTPEQALNIVLNDPVLKNDPVIQKYPDDIDPITCRWLLGAEAHRKWRELLYSAISAGELTLLDFGSKLPVNIAPTESTATPAPAPSKSATDGKATPNWKMQIQAEATAHCLRLRKAGASPTTNSIVDSMARWCVDNNVRTDNGICPSANYLRTHVLGGKHWNVPN